MIKKTELMDYDGAKYFKTKEDIGDYLGLAFDSGDPKLIARAVGTAARAQGMLKIAKKTGFSRSGLYRSFSADGDPRLSTLSEVMSTIGYRLSCTAMRAG
jgi:probable addiction module antidote protein